MTALAIARTGCPWLPVAHFIQGQSTARWFYDAEPIRDPGLLAHHCRYAEMVGYRNIALDYEDPATFAKTVAADSAMYKELIGVLGIKAD